MNYVKRTVAPTVRPVSLTEAKTHCHIDGTSEDSLIGIYLDAAITACENKLQNPIMDSRFTLYAKRFDCHMSLQKKFVSTINSVKYYDANGTQQTVDSSNYSLQDFKVPNVLYFRDYTFPNTDSREFPVEVDFNAGATAATGVLPNIRSAVFLEFGDRYENRQNEVVGERMELVLFNSTAEKILTEECLWL